MNKSVDYLIVGMGFAGACFALQCLKNGKSFHVIDGQERSASSIAAGVFNPVVLKRFTPIWKAEEQLDFLKNTLHDFSEITHNDYVIPFPVWRIFANEKETEIWKTKREDKPVLHRFLAENIVPNSFENIIAPHGYGLVQETGRIFFAQLLQDFTQKISDDFSREEFDYAQLNISSEGIEYKDIQAKKIVFCEGIKILENPWFNYLPIQPNKGETLIIKTKEKLPHAIVKGKVFVMPWEENTYYVGATYKRNATDRTPTPEGKEQLIQKLKTIFPGEFEIVEHRAGIRPTVPDYKPLLGFHPTYHNMGVINGMGTRVSFLAPYSAHQFFQFAEKKSELPEEMNITRFAPTAE